MMCVSAGTCPGCIAGTERLSPWCLPPAAGRVWCHGWMWRLWPLRHDGSDQSRRKGAEAFRVSRWTPAARA